MKICPTCNVEFNKNEDFCPNDGTKLVLKDSNTASVQFGDNALVTGDLNISSSESSQVENEIIGKTDAVSFGDKAIVSGDIKVESTTNIGHLTIHKDDTKIILKCSISGEELDYKNRFTCVSCSSVYAMRFKSSNEQCQNCARIEEESNEEKILELISEALEDNVFSAEERQSIFEKGKSFGLSEPAIEELIAISREKDRNHSELNKIHRIKFNSVVKDLEHFRIEKALKNLEMLHDVYPENNLVKKYYFLAKSMTNDFDEILNLKYDDIFKDFTVLLYYLKRENYRKFNKKVIEHNHILFSCAQIEQELLQCMKSNDFQSLDNLNEVLNEISALRDSSVQNEDEKAYVNFILSLYQMCRDMDSISAIQNDYMNLLADPRFNDFESPYLQNSSSWGLFHTYRIIGYPQFGNYIKNRKKVKLYLEKRRAILSDLQEFKQSIEGDGVVDFSSGQTVDEVNETYEKFKQFISADFKVLDLESTIVLDNIKNPKWNELESADKENLGKYFQLIKENYKSAINRIKTAEESHRITEEKKLRDSIDDLLNKINEAITQSDFEAADGLCKDLLVLNPDFDLSEVKAKLQQKVELNIKSSEQGIISLIIEYLKCFNGDLKVNDLFKKDNEHSRAIKYKLLSEIRDSGAMQNLYGIQKEHKKELDSLIYSLIDLNSIVLKLAYPSEKMIQIGSQLWFCENAEKLNTPLDNLQLTLAQNDRDWSIHSNKNLASYCDADENGLSSILYNGFAVDEFKRSLPPGIKIPNHKNAKELADIYSKLCKKKNRDVIEKLNKSNIEKYFACKAIRRDPNISFYNTEMHFWLDSRNANPALSFFKKTPGQQYYFKVNLNHNLIVNKDTSNNGMNIRFMATQIHVKQAMELLNK